MKITLPKLLEKASHFRVGLQHQQDCVKAKGDREWIFETPILTEDRKIESAYMSGYLDGQRESEGLEIRYRKALEEIAKDLDPESRWCGCGEGGGAYSTAARALKGDE